MLNITGPQPCPLYVWLCCNWWPMTRVVAKSFSGNPSARTAKLRGILLALFGVCALGFAIGATSHRDASATTQSPAAVIDDAFATLPAAAPRAVEPKTIQIDCSDFAVAFINAKCVKVWHKHASVRLRHLAARRSAMISNGH